MAKKHKFNPNGRERFIMLYAEDYDAYVWEEYCEALGVCSSETEVRINCDYSDVIAGSEMDES